MKVCSFSDMHGNLGFNVEPCDIVLICGDITPLSIQSNMIKSEEWMITTFIPWCQNLPSDKVIFIGGNHDWFLYNKPNRIKELLKEQDKVIYLDCELYEYNGVKIFGTPICKIFGNWAFMETQEEQNTKYDRYLKTINDVDILISHDAPYGVSDIVLQEDCWWAGEHIGNPALRDFIEKLQPRVCFHGHLHSTNHGMEKLLETEVYNVSLLNEDYKLIYKPLIFDYDY